MKTLKRIDKTGYTVLQLNRGKVNAINYEMVMELREAFKDIENDPGVRGVILTGQPHYFSAGLDLIELIRYDQKQISDFFEAFGALYLQLARFPKPFISAITGHAPAGGCVLAVTSDNRFMAEGEKYVIGLNEVAVNIPDFTESHRGLCLLDGRRSGQQVYPGRKITSGAEALSAGLVDELLPLEYVLERAEAKMQKYLKADPEIWVSTKKKVRKHWLDLLDTDATHSLKEAATLWWKPEIRQKMEAYVISFTTKS